MQKTKQTRADFDCWIQTQRDALYARAYRLTRNTTDAEDLVQDTFVRACTRWEQLKGEETAVAWLITMQRNLFINTYRKKLRSPVFSELTEDNLPQTFALCAGESESAETTAGRWMERRAVLQAIRSLPAKYREAIVLADMEELSYQEIADRSGTPIGTIRSRIARARKRLQRSLYTWRETSVYSSSPADDKAFFPESLSHYKAV